MDGMKKKRLHKRERAQRARGSSPRATGLRRVLNLRLLIVLLLAAAAVALYSMLDPQVPRNTSEQQDARVPIKRGPSWKDARVPIGRRASWKEIDDPAKDGWDTEVFASKAKKQLEALGNLLAHP